MDRGSQGIDQNQVDSWPGEEQTSAHSAIWLGPNISAIFSWASRSVRGGTGRESSRWFQKTGEAFIRPLKATASDEIIQEVGYGVYKESRPRMSKRTFCENGNV